MAEHEFVSEFTSISAWQRPLCPVQAGLDAIAEEAQQRLARAKANPDLQNSLMIHMRPARQRVADLNRKMSNIHMLQGLVENCPHDSRVVCPIARFALENFVENNQLIAGDTGNNG